MVATSRNRQLNNFAFVVELVLVAILSKGYVLAGTSHHYKLVAFKFYPKPHFEIWISG